MGSVVWSFLFESCQGWKRVSHGWVKVCSVIVFLLLLFSPARAEVATTRAFGEQTNLNFSVIGIGTDAGNTGPAPLVMQSGLSDYGPIEQQQAAFSRGFLNGQAGVSSGLLLVSVEYDNQAHDAHARAVVDDPAIDLSILSLLNLGLTADQIVSDSRITGHCGQLQALASSTLTNANLGVQGNNMALPVNPAPNMPISVNALGLAGVDLVLNEQVVSGNGVTDLSLTVNALRMNLSISLPLINVSGSIVFGHSESRVQCNSSDLVISKQATPNPAVANSPMVYTVRVDNQGPQSATAVRVEDHLPTGLNVISITPTSGGSCSQSGLVISCVWASIAAQSFASVDILVIPLSSGNLLNSAIVDTDDHDPNPGNNNISIITIVDPAPIPDPIPDPDPGPDPDPDPSPGPDPEADLAVSIGANTDSCFPGDTLVFNLIINNLGPSIALASQVTVSMPTQASVGQIQTGAGVSCSIQAQNLLCALGDIAVGGSRQLSFEASPSAAGNMLVSAQVSSSVADPVLGNNQDEVSVSVVPPPAERADVVIYGVVTPSVALLGEEITHRLTVINQGPDVATNTRLDVVLPTELALMAAAPVELGSCSDGVNHRVNCELGDIAVGEHRVIMIHTLAMGLGVMQASAITRADPPDPLPANNNILVGNEVIEPDGTNPGAGGAIPIPSLSPMGLLVLLFVLAVVARRELRIRV